MNKQVLRILENGIGEIRERKTKNRVQHRAETRDVRIRKSAGDKEREGNLKSWQWKGGRLSGHENETRNDR